MDLQNKSKRNNVHIGYTANYIVTTFYGGG